MAQNPTFSEIQDGRHLEKKQKQLYLGQLLTELHQIWCAARYLPCNGHYVPKSHFFLKSKMAAILKIQKQLYLGHLLTDLHQIWWAARYWPFKGHNGLKSHLF